MHFKLDYFDIGFFILVAFCIADGVLMIGLIIGVKLVVEIMFILMLLLFPVSIIFIIYGFIQDCRE